MRNVKAIFAPEHYFKPIHDSIQKIEFRAKEVLEEANLCGHDRQQKTSKTVEEIAQNYMQFYEEWKQNTGRPQVDTKNPRESQESKVIESTHQLLLSNPDMDPRTRRPHLKG